MDFSLEAEARTLDTWAPDTIIPLAQTALTCVLLEEVFPYGGMPELHDDIRASSRRPHHVCNAGGVSSWRGAVTFPLNIPLAQTARACVLLEGVNPYDDESQLNDDPHACSRRPHLVWRARVRRTIFLPLPT